MSKDYIFTSESVSEGHPDKMADQISDAVLDEIYRRDPNHAKACVACETLVKTGFVMLAGEITVTDADLKIDYERVVRRVVKEIGYDNSECGFDGNNCGVLIALGEQSKDINQGVDRESEEAQGAGDQGLMFGYATNETDMLMPAPIDYAHRLVKRQAEVRKNGTLPWLRPDAKSQVTMRYSNGKPVGVEAVVLSTQHSEDVSDSVLHEAVMEEIIKPVFGATGWLDANTKYHINPTGKFVIGGPVGDCGSPARIRPRSTARPPMPVAMWPRTSLPPGWPTSARSRCHMPSAWPSRPRSRSTPSAPTRSARIASSSWSARISICVPTASSVCST